MKKAGAKSKDPNAKSGQNAAKRKSDAISKNTVVPRNLNYPVQIKTVLLMTSTLAGGLSEDNG